MSTITWIIIVLIVVSIGVTVTEVGLRFGMLEKGKNERASLMPHLGMAGKNWTRADFSAPQLQAICGAEFVRKTFAEPDL
jgi:hypothetical protein